jgi:hypothetical protein
MPTVPLLTTAPGAAERTDGRRSEAGTIAGPATPFPVLAPEPPPLPLGPATRARACRVLEQHLGAVWAAVLESHGMDPAAGYRLTLEVLAIVPGPTAVVAGGDERPA